MNTYMCRVLASVVLVLLFGITAKSFAQMEQTLPSCPPEGVKSGCWGQSTSLSGIKHAGEYQRGLPNGRGTATLTDGSTYKGFFRNGLRHGNGTHVTAAGLIASGEWLNDKLNGQGVLNWPSGNRYVGEFLNNKPNGRGVLFLASGAQFVGDFRDGSRAGQGIEYKEDGSIKASGIWKDNNLQTQLAIPMSLYPFEASLKESSPLSSNAPITKPVAAHALVIGNAAYPGSGRLDNPVNDANAISQKLKSMGFTVTTVTDANRQKLVQSMAQFRLTAAAADVSLLFFAGHGVQIFGRNYILPTDVDQTDPAQATIQGISLNSVVENFLPGKTKLVFLDACRDNALQRSSDRSVSKGLAPISAAEGTLISYATKDGQTAADGLGSKNSPFTQALLEHLNDPQDIAVVLRKVRERVMQVTGGKQQPWEYGSLTGGELVLSAIRPK
jgi:hypothetical protein